MQAEFLASKNVEIVPHPPYSPDLAPSDFSLYPNMKKPMRGMRYNDRKEILDAVYANLRRLSENGFSHVFENWKKRWEKCIALGGVHIERTPNLKE
jgi:hypothetical protein